MVAGMRITVTSVAKKQPNERLNFSFVDQNNQAGVCVPSLRFLRQHPQFSVRPGDHLALEDFIPDFISGQKMPILVPESIQKLPSASN